MTLAVAHRGDSRGETENTLAAIVRAVELGADAVEVDLRTTADGVVVLHHDAKLKRVWGHRAAVADLTFRQLRDGFPRVPTLEEALGAVAGPGVPLVLDVGGAAVALAAHALADRLGALGSVWFCGRPAALAAVRAVDEEIPLMFSWNKYRRPGSRLLDAVRPTYYNPDHRRLSAAAVRSWHDRGVKVSTWTVDDAARREQLVSWGVDAIISNDVPGVVRSVRPSPGR